MGMHLKSEGIKKIAMESTGIYWIPIWNILEEMGFELLLVNPYLIKQMPGRKSDVKDAQWIAMLLHKGLLRGSLVPSPLIRELRCYSRKYMKLQGEITSTLQEIERTLEMCNIRITSLVSNISGKSIRKVVEHIISGLTRVEELEECVHGRIRNAHKEEVPMSLEGFVCEHHRFVLELLCEKLTLLERHSSSCLEKMDILVSGHYQEEKERLMTIPGISTLSAMIIIAETGADMEAFYSSNKFAGWTGLRPRNDESAGKYKSRATTKGNRYLRSILVQVGWTASRMKDSYFKEKFNRLTIRKSRKKALIAIARKMTVVIWHVLSDKQEYDSSKVPVYKKEKVVTSMNYHKKEIERLGRLIN
jgi:transposase